MIDVQVPAPFPMLPGWTVKTIDVERPRRHHTIWALDPFSYNTDVSAQLVALIALLTPLSGTLASLPAEYERCVFISIYDYSGYWSDESFDSDTLKTLADRNTWISLIFSNLTCFTRPDVLTKLKNNVPSEQLKVVFDRFCSVLVTNQDSLQIHPVLYEKAALWQSMPWPERPQDSYRHISTALADLRVDQSRDVQRATIGLLDVLVKNLI